MQVAHILCWWFFFVPLRCWSWKSTADAEPPCEGGSDDSDSGYVTSVWASQWPLPSPSTTPHEVRRRQGPGERSTRRCTHPIPQALLPQDPGTQHFSLDDDDSVPELWGSRPDRLSTVRPQERVQRHAVEQIGDSAPFLPSLDVPVPLMGEQLVVVYKLLDVMVPEQVIAVPKIIVGDIAPRRLCREPQMVDQLVIVPTNPDTVLCVFTRSPAPSMEDQLVEVPPIVPQPVPFFAGADGYVWRQLSGPTGAYWWRVGSSHTQWAPPPGYTARPGRETKTGRRDAGWRCGSGRPCVHAAQVPAVFGASFSSSTE